MRSFITGSRAYGKSAGLHGGTSDVDLVVLVNGTDLAILRSMADGDDGDQLKDSDAGPTAHGPKGSASLRFGKLNLIAVTDPVAFAVWHEGTRDLKQADGTDDPRTRVDRPMAIVFFEMLRRARGLYNSRPTVKEAAEEARRRSTSHKKKPKNQITDDDEDIPF